MSLTIDDLMATVRELKEADEKRVKLVVFRTEEGMSKTIRNIPVDTSPMDMPQMIVAPEFIPGDAWALCVADRDVAQAILKAKGVS